MLKAKTLITVHSGGLDAPANSRLYLKRACEQHPDIIEIDVQETADNVAVLSHDPYLPGIEIELKEINLEEAKSVYPELLTLEEAINLCSEYSCCLNLDIKELGVIRAAAEVVQKNLSENSFIFSGCGTLEVRELISIYPEARVLYNVPPREQSVYPDYSRFVLDAMTEVKRLGCFGLNISHDDLQPEIMGYSQLYDIPVFVWTVDDYEAMCDLIMMGVYSITTNKPDLLREAIISVSSITRKFEHTDWIKQ